MATDDPPSIADVIELLNAGRFAEAEVLCREIIESDPDEPDALHFHGLLLYHRGEAQEGAARIERSLAVRPDNPDAHLNLGNVLKERGDLERAEHHYRRALGLRPDFVPAHGNLGVVLRARGRFEEAVRAFERTLALSPSSPDVHYNLGNALRDLGRAEDAVRAWRQAISLNPRHSHARRGLAHFYEDEGRWDEARAVYEEWVREDPENPAAHFLLAASGEGPAPARAPDAFVRAEFDRMAQSFDSQLARRDYRGPEIVAAALAEAGLPADASLTVLDAGCGTGLAARELKAYARHLVGVDLSPQMLLRAREEGSYDALVEAELTEHLEERPGAYDLIAASDTLNYFGDLSPVLSAAGGALRPDGTLLAILEKADPEEASEGFRLAPAGRYVHTRDYVLGTLADARFEVRRVTEEVLRTEGDRPVVVWVVTARRRG